MKYEAGERDLVMLQHKFVVEWQDGKTVRLVHLLVRNVALIPAIGHYHLNLRSVW